MENLIRTIEGWDYSTVDGRCFENEGCIVDLGCRDWDWSRIFIGKKRVIGVDPFEKQILDTEFFKGIIDTYDGQTKILDVGIGTSSRFNSSGESVEVKAWNTFIKEYNIGKIAILKLNIEGGEYDIIDNFSDDDFDNIDQIAVSFHENINNEFIGRTEKTLKLLELKNYKVIKTNEEWYWYLAIKNN
jgi:hypothetical protein